MQSERPTISPGSRRRLRRVLYRSVLGVLVVCYFAAPILLETFDPPADPDQNKCSQGRPNDPIHTPRPNSGVVKIIQLTNSGEFVNRCELTDALDELVWDRLPRGAFGPRRKPDAKSLPRFTVLYVHGWKHGADSSDSDLIHFQELITRLAQTNSDRQVLGVYVSWNAAWGLGFADNLSFWSKKLIADRIAQSAILTKIVGAIGSTLHATEPAADQFIAIGHSFGARLLFSGTGQILINEVQKAHPGFPRGQYRVVRGPADAVILLNPAFEASLFTAFNGVTRAEETFSPNQAPLVLSIATDADAATTYAFPLGQWLGGMHYPKERTTLGNYEDYFTHSLKPSQPTACGTPIPLAASEQFEAEGLCLERQDLGSGHIFHPHNPFIVARTGHAIISGHNDIWNPIFSRWLFRLVDTLRATHERSVTAESSSAGGGL